MDGNSFVYVSFLRERVIVCVRYGINYAQNSVLVVKKKQHFFVAYSVTHRMRPSAEKKVKDTWKIVYLNSGALS